MCVCVLVFVTVIRRLELNEDRRSMGGGDAHREKSKMGGEGTRTNLETENICRGKESCGMGK